ncbi:MAG: hypothetical protein OXI01_02335 [Albidovulum sp.]|nr:hypothetical protein [Albidovulum sp.]
MASFPKSRRENSLHIVIFDPPDHSIWHTPGQVSSGLPNPRLSEIASLANSNIPASNFQNRLLAPILQGFRFPEMRLKEMDEEEVFLIFQG